MALQPLKADAVVVTEPQEQIVREFTKDEIIQIVKDSDAAFSRKQVVFDIYGGDLYIDVGTGVMGVKDAKGAELGLFLRRIYTGEVTKARVVFPAFAENTNETIFEGPTAVSYNTDACVFSFFAVYGLNNENGEPLFDSIWFSGTLTGDPGDVLWLMLTVHAFSSEDAQALIALLLSDPTKYIRLVFTLEK